MINCLLTLFLAGDQILQKVNGDLLIRREIYASIDGKEIIAFTLARLLRAKLLGRYLLILRLIALDLLVCVLFHIF